MNRISAAVLALLTPLLATGATHKPVHKPAHAKAPSVRSRSSRGKTAGKPAPPQHSQMAPTSDRYREIQQALAAKGYLKSEPSGVWDADTQDAMRRFQTDRKLDQTGRIDSLSLISLGLGPKN